MHECVIIDFNMYIIIMYDEYFTFSQNGVFIEPKNTQFLDNGAVTQLDGDHTPDYTDISGANYFERNTQLLHMV